jgi:hypothetical protein
MDLGLVKETETEVFWEGGVISASGTPTALVDKHVIHDILCNVSSVGLYLQTGMCHFSGHVCLSCLAGGLV